MKDSYYFTHDYRARHDPKMVDLMSVHGLAGIGAYWCIVEMLYERDGEISVTEYKSISFLLHTDTKLIESVVNDFGLFENDGEKFWSKSVLARINKRNAVSESRKKAISARWQRQKETNEVQTDTNVIQNDTNNKIINKNIKELSSNEDKGEKPQKRFVPPTLQEIKDYIVEKGYSQVDAEKFFNFYESKGWYVGRNKMKNWRAAVANWARTENERPAGRRNSTQQSKKANDEWT